MIRVHCDKCGANVDNGMALVTIHTGSNPQPQVIHLCIPDLERLHNWLAIVEQRPKGVILDHSKTEIPEKPDLAG